MVTQCYRCRGVVAVENGEVTARTKHPVGFFHGALRAGNVTQHRIASNDVEHRILEGK
jgi:hypothetical protein